MKETVKKIIDVFFITFGIFAFFGIFDPNTLIGLAKAVDVILHPLLALPILVVIFILALFTAIYTNAIQIALIDIEEMKRIQREVMKFQKEYMEAVKQDNKAKLKKLEERQKEIQMMQGQLMGPQLKVMAYSMAITMPIFYWLLYVVYGNKLIRGLRVAYSSASGYVVNAPFFGHIHLSHPVITFPIPVPWWIFWYFVCSMPLTMLFRKAMGI